MLLRESRVATSVNMRPFDLKGVQAVEKRKEDEKIKKRNMGQKKRKWKKMDAKWVKWVLWFFFSYEKKKGKTEEKKRCGSLLVQSMNLTLQKITKERNQFFFFFISLLGIILTLLSRILGRFVFPRHFWFFQKQQNNQTQERQ